MANNTSEEFYAITGSNLQICFVNEHHQANESNDTENLKTQLKNSKFDEINSSTITNNNEDILTKQQRLKV